MNIKRAFLAAVAVLMVPGFAMAQSTVTFSTLISNDLAGAPEMTITCNGGIPLSQSGAIGTTFTVTNIALGNECTVEMTGALNDGYEIDYTACLPTGDPRPTGCFFIMVDGQTDNQTQVWVQESPADFYVDVAWTISDEADEGIGDSAMVEVMCGSTSTTLAAGPDVDMPILAVADVDVGTVCQASISGVSSAVDVSPDVCLEEVELDGGDITCAFTATAFYEGIPTLSQYGMAIMALLMLAVGFVGFRRFV